jgi:hypothetical protein
VLRKAFWIRASLKYIGEIKGNCFGRAGGYVDFEPVYISVLVSSLLRS